MSATELDPRASDTRTPATDFTQLAGPVHARYNELAQGELFTVEVEDIAAAYLSAWPEGTNPIYKTNTEHDCSCCKNFLRNLGKVVGIDEDGKVLTVWDGHESLPYPYNVVAKAMQSLVQAAPITGVFRASERQYGTSHNYDADNQRWSHFHGRVADRHFSATPDKDRGEFSATAQVLRRGLDELNPEDVGTVLDLIESKSLYRGEEHKAALLGFRDLQRRYLEATNRVTFVWANLGNRAARFRNTAIGTLLVDLAAGADLEGAVRGFESKVAPANYKRPTSLITPRMVADAEAKLAELGLEQAIERRLARIDDVHVNDALFVDRSVRPKMKGGLSDLLAGEVKSKPVSLKGAVAISAEDFFGSVVPGAKSISVLLENRHLGNFVSLTGPVHENTGRLFKWPNDFAWSYDGDVADSIKARVKAAGGKVDALFRVSLAWYNFDDLDLHATTPDGHHIYYGSKRDYISGGRLDVDMNVSPTTRAAVENVFWHDKVPNGTYLFQVKNYTRRENVDVGFALELEFDGAVQQFSYQNAVGHGQTVPALRVAVRDGKLDSVEPLSGITGGDLPTEKWGLTTGQLVPVDTLMLSPNYWGGEGVGNKHYIFALRGASNPEPVRGIYNEFLRSELEPHRKVFEVLGAKTKAAPDPQGLSGLGFSSTRRDEVLATVDGRPYHIKF